MLPQTISCRIDSKIYSHKSRWGDIHTLFRLWVNPDGTGAIDGVDEDEFNTILSYFLGGMVASYFQNLQEDEDMETIEAVASDPENRSFTWKRVKYVHH